MGRPKLALPLGSRTVLECVLYNLREAGVTRNLVVLGPHVAELSKLARSAGASVLQLAEPTPGMRETLEAGWNWIEATWDPQPEAGCLLTPADHPLLDPHVATALFEARESNRSKVIIPVHEGTRGHPALICWEHVAGIRLLPRGLGINAWLRANPDRVLEIPVRSETILLDMDTPDDYDRLCKLVEQGR